CGALQCSLQIARSPILVRNALAQLFEPPYTDPYVRWCGRGGAERLPPIPIVGTFRTRRDVRIESVKHRKADMHLVAPTDFDLRAQGLPLPIPYDLRKPRVGIAARA